MPVFLKLFFGVWIIIVVSEKNPIKIGELCTAAVKCERS